jgi:hypothetical protein
VAVTQGATYLVTGLWPLVHMRSFEAVTGPKLEGWLVKTVGLLIGSIGAALLTSARSSAAARPVLVLGTTSAAVLAGVDVYYVAKRRIKPIYLLDAALELAFVVAWSLSRRPPAPR